MRSRDEVLTVESINDRIRELEAQQAAITDAVCDDLRMKIACLFDDSHRGAITTEQYVSDCRGLIRAALYAAMTPKVPRG